MASLNFETAFAVAHGIPVTADNADYIDELVQQAWEEKASAPDAIDEEEVRAAAVAAVNRPGGIEEERRRDEIIATDPLLGLLAGFVDQRDLIDAQIRSLTCLYREWADPPLPLSALASVLRASPSGVRVSYTDETRDNVAELTGVPPRASRDPVRPVWKPGKHTPDSYYLGIDSHGEPVTVPYGIGLAVVAGPEKRETQAAQRLLISQIIAREFPRIRHGQAEPADMQALLIRMGNIDSQLRQECLYGPVTDTFMHAGRTIALANVLPAFTETDTTSVAVIAAAAPTSPPKRSVLIGIALERVAEQWGAEIPTITGPRLSHDWRWSLRAPDAAPVEFRLAATDAEWPNSLIAALKEQEQSSRVGDDIARVASHYVRSLLL